MTNPELSTLARDCLDALQRWWPSYSRIPAIQDAIESDHDYRPSYTATYTALDQLVQSHLAEAHPMVAAWRLSATGATHLVLANS